MPSVRSCPRSLEKGGAKRTCASAIGGSGKKAHGRYRKEHLGNQPVHAVRRCLSSRARIGRKSAASVHARESNAALVRPPRPTSRLPRNADIRNTGPASRKSTRSTGRPTVWASISIKARRCVEPSGPSARHRDIPTLSGRAVPSATDPRNGSKLNGRIGRQARRHLLKQLRFSDANRQGGIMARSPPASEGTEPCASARMTAGVRASDPLPATAVAVVRGIGRQRFLDAGVVDAQRSAGIVRLRAACHRRCGCHVRRADR